jgi:uncharacterized protein (DUF342 family)
VKNKKDILSAKKAFAELQSLKQQMQISKRKYMQSQQSVVALVSRCRSAFHSRRQLFSRHGSDATTPSETRPEEPVGKAVVDAAEPA